MKERPILFSAPMVRALLAGTKTQTRRAAKPQPPAEAPLIHVGEYAPALIDRRGEMYPGEDVFGAEFDDGSDGAWCIKCPYGAPGDRLWVKETWCSAYSRGCFGVMYAADGAFLQTGKRAEKGPHFDGDLPQPNPFVKWRPSIFMPRWASRITLEITEVRVQRLHEIWEADAAAEGIDRITGGWRSYDPNDALCAYVTARGSFFSLWREINGAESYAANPWVWALTFKRVAP